jgi:hypothetical protein
MVEYLYVLYEKKFQKNVDFGLLLYTIFNNL